MKLNTNNFKKNLNLEVQYGCWVGMGAGYSAEILATVGYDWLLLDSEHAPNTIVSLLEQLQAIKPYSSQPIIRVDSMDKDKIKRVLDIGAQTIMVPMVETAEDAKRLVSSMYYPPIGRRGVGGGLTRATKWGKINNYLTEAHKETCLIVQIESELGVKNAKEIAEVDGVDAIFIGPADLSINLGYPDDPNASVVQDSIRSIISSVNKAGKACGILAPLEADAKKYIELGCKFIAIGIDISFMLQSAHENLHKYKDNKINLNNSNSY